MCDVCTSQDNSLWPRCASTCTCTSCSSSCLVLSSLSTSSSASSLTTSTCRRKRFLSSSYSSCVGFNKTIATCAGFTSLIINLLLSYILVSYIVQCKFIMMPLMQPKQRGRLCITSSKTVQETQLKLAVADRTKPEVEIWRRPKKSTF